MTLSISSVLELFGTFSFKCIAEESPNRLSNCQPTYIIRQLSAIVLTELKYQGPTSEKATAQKPNQGGRKKRAAYRFFLDFLVLFYQEKSTEKTFAT